LVHRWVMGKHGLTKLTTSQIWGKPPLSPYNILYVWPRGQHPNVIMSQDSQVGVPKFSNLGLLRIWKPITLCVELWLKWGLKKHNSPCWELFDDMWQATYTQINQNNSRLLVVMNQIGTLTFNFSFGHNLCFKYPNGSYESILGICVQRAFQWYKEIFNPMNFDTWNCPLKIWKSIKTPTPKVEAHLGMWGFIPSHSPTFLGAWNVTLGLHSWPTPLQAFKLVVSLKLGLRHCECLEFWFEREKKHQIGPLGHHLKYPKA